MIPAYPLQWPTGWPRATSRKDAPFSTGGTRKGSARDLNVKDGLQRVLQELERLRISRNDIVVSSNVALRLDGYPRSDQANPSDPGVAVYWQKGKVRSVMAIDIYRKVPDNLAAVAKSLDALRAIERHGGARILERAFTGFVALPERTGASTEWRVILEYGNGPANRAEIEHNFRILAKHAHPDKGGSGEYMVALNLARAAALAEAAALQSGASK